MEYEQLAPAERVEFGSTFSDASFQYISSIVNAFHTRPEKFTLLPLSQVNEHDIQLFPQALASHT